MDVAGRMIRQANRTIIGRSPIRASVPYFSNFPYFLRTSGTQVINVIKWYSIRRPTVIKTYQRDLVREVPYIFNVYVAWLSPEDTRFRYASTTFFNSSFGR